MKKYFSFLALGLMVAFSACNESALEAQDSVDVASRVAVASQGLVLGSGANAFTIDPSIIAPAKLQALMEEYDIDPATVRQASSLDDIRICLFTSPYAWVSFDSPSGILLGPANQEIMVEPLMVTPDNKTLLIFTVETVVDSTVILSNGVSWQTTLPPNSWNKRTYDYSGMAPMNPNGPTSYGIYVNLHP